MKIGKGRWRGNSVFKLGGPHGPDQSPSISIQNCSRVRILILKLGKVRGGAIHFSNWDDPVEGQFHSEIGRNPWRDNSVLKLGKVRGGAILF